MKKLLTLLMLPLLLPACFQAASETTSPISIAGTTAPTDDIYLELRLQLVDEIRALGVTFFMATRLRKASKFRCSVHLTNEKG